MAFEQFTKKAARAAGVPYVAIQKRGIFSFNDAAYSALGSPKAVTLLFDRDRLLIGFRPAEGTNEDAYDMRPGGKNAGHVITGTLFTNYYGIPTDAGRRWPAHMIDGGILAIDLNDPPQGTTTPIAVGGKPSLDSDG